ncbi:Kynurenine formamidase [Maioricimonas rarisocia]|uniref:Kynurenine formamidase n=1 Tax=Maioricimonas rarisocia TaxID=2528026 RepID=A0A517ZDS1_9PLAN|nr:cyclase family protein [Maioricimonas rarisocia]QDU40632.1 Kynurenine formamidase [Maioricimonas rarisocia]
MLLLRALLLAASLTVPAGIVMAQVPSADASLTAVMASARFVDLTWPLNEENAFWPGDNYQPFELKTIATLEKDGVYSRKFSMPEHLGTHIDAPNHFESGQPDVAALTAEQLCGPGVLLDITVKAEQNPDAMLRIGDIQAWEEEHGRIPDGAIVLLRTGWGRFWNNPVRYQNRDARGQLHFPSFSPEAAEYLVEKRNIRGLGVDNLSIDRGISRDFEVHHIVNAAERYGLENVAHLDRLPARGFYLIVAPIKIEGGTGGPTRIWAVLPGK